MVQPAFRTFDIGDMNLVCIGDIHGEFPTLRFMVSEYIRKYSLTDTVFVVCGDCGFFGTGTNENKWKTVERLKLNAILEKNRCHLYMFRGNHDDPKLFTDEYIVGDTRALRNLHVLNDYDVLKSKLYGRILIVPGAFSIDRAWRIPGVSYFVDEDVVRLSDGQLESLGKCDIVLSHSLPYFDAKSSHNPALQPYRERDNKRYVEVGDTFDDKLHWQEETLRSIQCHVQAKRWISGHYHQSEEFSVDGTNYTALDINEFYNVIPVYAI